MTARYCITIFCITTLAVQAQQQATYAQYMSNGLAINPAYAGSHESLSATVLARFQNVGLKGAPNTQTFSAHSPLLSKRVALGLLVVRDQLSVISQTGVHASYAYRIPVSEKNKGVLSFGLQAGVSFYKAEYSQLDVLDQTDPAFAQDRRQTRPNIGAGVFYSTNLTYVGLSVPSLLNNVFDRSEDFKTIYQSKPIILTGGHVFELNRMIKLKPNLLFKIVDNRPVEFDVNVNALFDEVAWVGVSYKSSKQVVLLTQVQITDQLLFGYSYTITASKLRYAELGSHEAMLNYRFNFIKKGSFPLVISNEEVFNSNTTGVFAPAGIHAEYKRIYPFFETTKKSRSLLQSLCL